MVGKVSNEFLKEATRQARSMFERASTRSIEKDIAEIASHASDEAHRQFPADEDRQREHIEHKVSEALKRRLGDLKGHTVQ